MSKVIFILTFFWFDRVACGKKNAEYRRQNKFWETKLAGLKAGAKVLLRKGYSHTYLEKTVAGVELVSGSELPDLERNFFKAEDDEPFFKVVFLRQRQILKQVQGDGNGKMGTAKSQKGGGPRLQPSGATGKMEDYDK